jgi:hypothetical protein
VRPRTRKRRISAARADPPKRQGPIPLAAARTRQETDALAVSVKRLNELADSLGVLDPLDVEPALVYDPEDRGE